MILLKRPFFLKFVSLLFLTFFTFFLSTSLVFALPTDGGNGTIGPNGNSVGGNGNSSDTTTSNATVGKINSFQLGVPTDINSIIASLVQLAYAVAGIVFFFMFIYGGLRYLLAGGDEKATMAARGTLTNAFIGLVIVVAAFVITQLLFSIFHLNGFIRLG